MLESDDQVVSRKVSELLIEYEMVNLIVLNMLDKKLVSSSLNILCHLLLSREESDYKKSANIVWDDTLIQILKAVTMKYKHDPSYLYEISIVIYQVAQREPIKMKEQSDTEFVETLHSVLTDQNCKFMKILFDIDETHDADEELSDQIKNTVRNILKIIT